MGGLKEEQWRCSVRTAIARTSKYHFHKDLQTKTN